MTQNLKKDTVSGLIWTALDKIGVQVIAILITIITARVLSPKDFGLIGALAIFTLLCNLLIESGFSTALIRRKINTDAEYSAIFYFNISLSLILYGILFISAPLIADFFHMPELCSLARVLFLTLIINSLGIVQTVIITKELAFRFSSIANIISAVISGVITLILVLVGVDYWALAWQIVIQTTVRVIIVMTYGTWKIKRNADFRIIRELFSFSFFLLITSFINILVRNIYNLIIGRLYTVQDLGYYSQANKFQQIPSNIAIMTLSGVSYPVLSKLNLEPERQLLYLRKIMRIASFVIFPIMIGLLSLSTELVKIVLTDKWLPAIPYFQLLVIAGILAPFHSLNINILNAKGLSKDIFSLEMIKNGLILISIIICSKNIELMLIGFTAANVISYVVDLFFIQYRTEYKAIDQIKDIIPYGLISAVMFVLVKLVGYIDLGFYTTTAIQLLAGIVFYVGTIRLLGSQVLKDTIALLRKNR